MFELEERDRLRKTYRLCQSGFGILSLALSLASLTFILSLAYEFTRFWVIREIFASSWYPWIDTPIVWGSLLGTTILWGRWESPSWQRRAGLLLVMCLVDVVLWAMDQGHVLAIMDREFGHRWLRGNLGQALFWAELALIGSLACDYLVHLGVDQAREALKPIRSLITTGAAVWILLFCLETNWKEGWPLQRGGRIGEPEGVLLAIGVAMIQTIILFQVTGLTLLAARRSNSMIEEMDREDPYRDFLSPSSDLGVKDSRDAVSSLTRDDRD